MVPVVTLSFLSTVIAYPKSWPNLNLESLGIIVNKTTQLLALTSMSAIPDRVVARVSRSGVITVVLKNIQHPSPRGPAAQIDTTVRSAFVASCDHLLIQFIDIGAGFLLVQTRLACSVRPRLALRSRGTSNLRTACRRGCCHRRRQTRARGVRSRIMSFSVKG